MSVKVQEAFCFDSFMDRLLFFDDFHGDQLQDEWRSVSTGTTAVIDAQTGGIVRLLTGALDTNAEYIDWQDIRSLHIDKKVSMEVRIKLNQTTDINVTINLYFDANNHVVFRFNTGLDVNWLIRARNNAANTSGDSGIPPDTDYHIYRIECFPTDEVHFYIDGVECANSPITTNIPDDAGDFLQPLFLIQTLEDVAKSMDIDYVYVRQER